MNFLGTHVPGQVILFNGRCFPEQFISCPISLLPREPAALDLGNNRDAVANNGLPDAVHEVEDAWMLARQLGVKGLVETERTDKV